MLKSMYPISYNPYAMTTTSSYSLYGSPDTDEPTKIKYVFDLDYTLYSRHDVETHPNSETALLYHTFQKKHYLQQLLRSLSGDKFLFTNANRFHTDTVLRHADINPQIFKDIVSYDRMGCYKPTVGSFQFARRSFRIQPDDTVIFFEDNLDNLKASKDLYGWVTVWIQPQLRVPIPQYVDYCFPNIEEALLFFVVRGRTVLSK